MIANTIVHSNEPERIIALCRDGVITPTQAVGALIANCGRTLRRTRWLISFSALPPREANPEVFGR